MTTRHWWNGRWGRLVRRDVFARPASEGQWQVELRRGGPGGRSRSRSFGSEADALAWVDRILHDVGAGWREVSASAAAAPARSGARKKKLAS